LFIQYLFKLFININNINRYLTHSIKPHFFKIFMDSSIGFSFPFIIQKKKKKKKIINLKKNKKKKKKI